MNFRHAVGFLAVGTVLGLLPGWVPGLVETAGMDGTSARALWLQLMSWVQIGLAGGYFLQRVLAAAAVVMEYDPRRTADAARVETPARSDAGSLAGLRQPARAGLRMLAAVEPAKLKAALLEQRQAA